MKTKEGMSGKKTVKISNTVGPGTPQGYETKILWVKTLSPECTQGRKKYILEV